MTSSPFLRRSCLDTSHDAMACTAMPSPELRARSASIRVLCSSWSRRLSSIR